MNLFKKLVKACTTWRSSSSASSDKEQSQWSATDYTNELKIKDYMAQHPLMNSAQMWVNPPSVGQNTLMGNNTYNPSTMQHESSVERICAFTVEKADNGYVLRSGSRAKVCKDMNELRDFFVSTMVERQLDR